MDPDGAGPAEPFSFGNPDFRSRSLRGTAVLRWEYRPGSTFFLVWQQSRSHFGATPGLNGLGELRSPFRLAPDIFLVKMNYWLSL